MKQYQVEFRLKKGLDKRTKDRLEAKYGVIASPEKVHAYSLGLALRGHFPHSKRYIIEQYLSSMEKDIRRPEVDIYKKYMDSERKPKKDVVLSFLGRF